MFNNQTALSVLKGLSNLKRLNIFYWNRPKFSAYKHVYFKKSVFSFFCLDLLQMRFDISFKVVAIISYTAFFSPFFYCIKLFLVCVILQMWLLFLSVPPSPPLKRCGLRFLSRGSAAAAAAESRQLVGVPPSWVLDRHSFSNICSWLKSAHYLLFYACSTPPLSHTYWSLVVDRS